MRIRWHGHSCFEFSNGDLTVVTDPHDGRSLGIKPVTASADVVLMSHDHYDHNASRVIKGDHLDIMMQFGDIDAKGLKVKGFQSYHDYSQGSERGMNSIYLFTMDDITLCHCGDLGSIPSQDVLDAIHGVDFLFIPVGETYTMELPDIKKFIELVNPRIIVPMHFMVGGLSFRLSSLNKFLEIIPDNVQDFVGNEIDITVGDLPTMKECWVFDC